MADGQVNVPLIGETNKSTLFIAGLAGLTALGWALWHQHESAKKAAASTASNAGGAGSTAPPGTTGYGYAYGYGAYAYQPYGYGYGPEGLGAYGGQGDYGYGYYGAGEPVNEEVPAAASTNAQWSEAAMTALTSAGWTASDVLTALGLYITGSPVTATQAQIIQAAIAAEGYPPSPGATGYPPAINQSSSTGQSGTTTAGKVSVPNVVGQAQEAGFAILSEAGLHATGTPVVKGKTLYVVSQSPAAGTQVASGSTVALKSNLTAPKVPPAP